MHQNQNNDGLVKYKVFTTTHKSCQQNMYHLATFNNMLCNSNDLPKTVREEQATISKTHYINADDSIKDISQLVNQEKNKIGVNNPAEKMVKTQDKVHRFVFEENDQNTPKNEKVKYYGEDSTKA